MNEEAIGRRTFLAGAAALTASGVLAPGEGRAQTPVPNSSGTESAKVKAPANAADCHIHIYDPRFPQATPRPGRIPSNATVADYRLLQKRNGTTRVVVVTPRNYGTDNRVTVDALSQLGANSRGIAVLHPDVADTELKALDAAGIRGIRFTLQDPATAVVKWDMVEPLAKRVAGLGWHLQFNLDGPARRVGSEEKARPPAGGGLNTGQCLMIASGDAHSNRCFSVNVARHFSTASNSSITRSSLETRVLLKNLSPSPRWASCGLRGP